MKSFTYHSHGRTHTVEVRESMSLREQMDAVERAVAESECRMGASPEEAAARARVMLTLMLPHVRLRRRRPL